MSELTALVMKCAVKVTRDLPDKIIALKEKELLFSVNVSLSSL